MHFSRLQTSRLSRWIPILVLSLSSQVAAQTNDTRLPVSLDADATAYDGKSSVVMFRGLRLTQGRLGISADEGFRVSAGKLLILQFPT